MPDDFLHNEVQELFREVRIEFGGFRQATQPRDLSCLACWVGRCKPMSRLVFSYCLGALETLRKQMNERRVDIIDALSQAQKFRVGHSDLVSLGMELLRESA